MQNKIISITFIIGKIFIYYKNFLLLQNFCQTYIGQKLKYVLRLIVYKLFDNTQYFGLASRQRQAKWKACVAIL
jgi:hypothetical protein